jgi:hypothetical protein
MTNFFADKDVFASAGDAGAGVEGVRACTRGVGTSHSSLSGTSASSDVPTIFGI